MAATTLSSQFHSLAVLLHQWCVNSRRDGPEVAVHIPAFRSLVSCKPTTPSSFTTTEGMGVEAVTLPLPRAVGTDSANLLLNLLMVHCYLKLHVNKKNTNRYWKLRRIS